MKNTAIYKFELATGTEFEAEVRILAEAEGWAMVRRKGAAPFVVRSKDLLRRASKAKGRKP